MLRKLSAYAYLVLCISAFVIECQKGKQVSESQAKKLSAICCLSNGRDSYSSSLFNTCRLVQTWCLIRSRRDRTRRSRPSKHAVMLCIAIMIALSGDIESNPGPRCLKYPCGECGKSVTVRQKGVACDSCDTWYHAKCMGMRDIIYNNLGNASWHCLKCALPNVSLFLNSETDISTTNHFDTLRDLSGSLESLDSLNGANSPLACYHHRPYMLRIIASTATGV